MTRVIAGAHKGREIKVPKTVTRPTSSKVREAIFSTLNHALSGFTDLRILDLFAGSGACAIESISRGASEALAVEKDSRAIQTIKSNAQNLGITSLRTLAMDALSAVGGEAKFGKFDLVFIDPPYSVKDEVISQLLEQLAQGWLTDGAIVVVERAKSSSFNYPVKLVEFSKKVYGDTSVWYGQYEE